MTRFNRRNFLKNTVLSLAILASSTAFVQQLSAAEKSVLISRVHNDISMLDPAFAGNVPDEAVMGAIYNKLVYYKPGSKWGWELQAAESIEQTDPTHISFTLKPGITFSNDFGEMTAEDVKYSFERIIDPAMKSPNADNWSALDHVEVTDRYSGVIVLKEPSQALWSLTLPYISGNIISKKATESVGGKFATNPPAISGPYRIKEWLPKEAVILERNPQWTGEITGYDEIQIRQIDDEKTAEIAFEAGDIDFTRVSLSSLGRYREEAPENSQLIENPSLYYVWLGMNFDHPKLQDIRVRQAIQSAIDIPSIISAAYFDAVAPANGIIAPGLIGHRPEPGIPHKADFAKSKALLKEAGAENLELDLDILNKSTFVTSAQVIQATLAQAGIKLNINLHESGAFWSLGDEKAGDRYKNIQLIMNRYAMAPDPSYATVWFTTAQKGIWNWERFANAEFDTLHNKATSEGDATKRDQMYRDMQTLMEDSGGYRFITHEATPVIHRNTVKPALRPDGEPLYRLFQPAK